MKGQRCPGMHGPKTQNRGGGEEPSFQEPQEYQRFAQDSATAPASTFLPPRSCLHVPPGTLLKDGLRAVRPRGGGSSLQPVWQERHQLRDDCDPPHTLNKITALWRGVPERWNVGSWPLGLRDVQDGSITAAPGSCWGSKLFWIPATVVSGLPGLQASIELQAVMFQTCWVLCSHRVTDVCRYSMAGSHLQELEQTSYPADGLCVASQNSVLSNTYRTEVQM
ncbi:uncharacterized protein LOC132647953 [Meriones unguiculatus]|uniref:uncharacterized protein LOC132647953 n=1 Tax=Meriones unguiculatus TaxID=10047 RepID=UPI00293E7083|nr:uncharacterized protein LOC132647953 [Meriones unguiculatus]